MASEEARGDPDSAVPLPASDGSSGICTFRRGRAMPDTALALPTRLLDRDGGVNVVSGMDTAIDPVLLSSACSIEPDRCGTGGELVTPSLFASSVCGRPLLESLASPWNTARCWEKMERFSSIGVKMLPCLRCGNFLIAAPAIGNGGCREGSVVSGSSSPGAGPDGCGSCGRGGLRCRGWGGLCIGW